MKRTKICHITTVHTVFDVRIFHKECLSLSEEFEVYLIARNTQSKTVEGIHIVSIGNIPARGFGRCINFFRALRQALKIRAAIYHFHDPELLLLGLILKWITGGKVIYDMHEDVQAHALSKSWLPGAIRFNLAHGLRGLEKTVLPFLDTTIIAAPSLRAIYRKAILVRNFPVLRKMRSKERVSSRDKSLSLIYLGAISRKRDPFILLEAVKILREKYRQIRLSLIGPVYPSSLTEEIQRAVYERNLGDTVEITGRVSFEEGQKRIFDADIGLCVLQPDPNYIDALPTKMFEYMLYGKPVVVSNFPAWKAIVDGAECGMTVDPLSPEAIARAVDHIVSSRTLMKKMGEKGRIAVLDHYLWQKESQILMDCYRRFLSVGKS